MRKVVISTLALGGLALLSASALVGCPGGASPGEERPAADEQRPEAEAPTPVDELVFVHVEEFSQAITMIEAGNIDIYADGTPDPVSERRIRASEALDYEISYGSTAELTFNPVGPTFANGALNPFHVPAIREAINWLIDRDHVVEEIYGGLAVPRYTALSTPFPDYARLIETVRGLEARYRHDPARAERIITREMEKLGAERTGGRWRYEGRPVEVKLLIRNDDERRDVGDYLGNLLEDVGFRVDRNYRTAQEASVIWISGDPASGDWHVYTGGWISTVVARDQAENFNYYYTSRGRPEPLWRAYQPSERFDDVSDRLDRRDYATWEERQALMAEALELSLEDSVRLWLVDIINIWPRRAEATLAADLAGGVSGSFLWPLTLQYTKPRATIGVKSIFTEPWNPIAGSNWIFDQFIVRATGETALMPDPFTGLYLPQRIERAEVTVREGLPVMRTHDWVELRFEPEIEVPADAWVDWDAEAQRFIDVASRHPDGLTARTRTVIDFDEGLLDMRWHDGSAMSIADALMPLILTFDRADEASEVFDEAYGPNFESFKRHFRGARILEEEPLRVEIYSDQIFPDAERIVYERSALFYPYYLHGPGPWHKLALGIRAEGARELAFSTGKADRRRVEQMSYIAGPSLAILRRHLAAALEEAYIPYAETLGRYISADEARERYENLDRWHRERDHFWVGQGPFYLHAVHPVANQAVMRRFADFPDPPDRWLRFAAPMRPAVAVTGPRRVVRGSEASFDVEVTFERAPYAAEDIDQVTYLLFDAEASIVASGEAEAVEDGLWRVRLGAEQTSALEEGSNRLEAVAVSRLVSLPSFADRSFITLDP